MTQIEFVRREIVHLNLQTKELIQEIQNCKGPLEILNDLNHEGRKLISLLRNNLKLLKSIANEEENRNVQKLLLEEIKTNEAELAATITAFQQANIASLVAIDTANKRELLGETEESLLKHRIKKDKEGLIKKSTNVTDQLLSISRCLSDSMHRSANTLDTLAAATYNAFNVTKAMKLLNEEEKLEKTEYKIISSGEGVNNLNGTVNTSTTADGTKVELDSAGNFIAQSGKLVAKYGRREQTEKVLVFFAFVFFLACAFYVLQKRLF